MFLVITGLAQESRIAAGPGVSHVVCSGSDTGRLRNQLSGLNPTGLRAVPGCAADIVAIVVPGNAQLPARPGCGFPDASTAPAPAAAKPESHDLLNRAKNWLHAVTH